MARLEIERLQKAFGGVPLLDGATLNVERGETVAVYGRSGSGKSILLSILSGALAADGGDIRIDGSSVVEAPPEQRDIGMAFQNFALYPHMTAYDNIASPLRGKKNAAGDIDEKIKSVARLLKIDSVLSHFPQALSNGQKQRTSLARALVAEPAVLLLDDPLRNVDAKLRYEMRLEMPDLFRRFESSVIYVTQDSREAMALADRIAILHGGRFMQVGTPGEVYEFPRDTEVGRLLGEPTLNLFRCKTCKRDGSLFIEPGNCRVNISGHYDLAEGSHCIAGVRPEDVVISTPCGDSDDSDGSIGAVIASVTPANIRFFLVLKTESGEEITASPPEQEALRYAGGERARVSFPVEKILLFSDGDERLIERTEQAPGG